MGGKAEMSERDEQSSIGALNLSFASHVLETVPKTMSVKACVPVVILCRNMECATRGH